MGPYLVRLVVYPVSRRTCRLARAGVGTEIMQIAEREALQRGCCGSWLDTFEFQARGFYERIGYQCFGELPNYPPGFSRFFMKKMLTQIQE